MFRPKRRGRFPSTCQTSENSLDSSKATGTSSARRGGQPSRALVTANVLIFVAAAIDGAGVIVPNPNVLQAWGTNFGPLSTNGQWCRPVSSIFLHFGLFHLALNMWALYVGGRLAERLFGNRLCIMVHCGFERSQDCGIGDPRRESMIGINQLRLSGRVNGGASWRGPNRVERCKRRRLKGSA